MIEIRSGLTISSSCAVEKRSAIRRALGSSFHPSSSNPIEKVRTGSGEVSAMAATTVAESMPPDRNAPRGTSEIIRSPHGLSNEAADLLVQLRAFGYRLGFVAQPPEALDRDASILVGQGRAGRQPPNGLERGERRGDVLIGEVGVEGMEVEVARDLSVGEKGGELRGEAEGAIALGVEERLLAEAIARQQQAVAARVPEREREHPLELFARIPRPAPRRGERSPRCRRASRSGGRGSRGRASAPCSCRSRRSGQRPPCGPRCRSADRPSRGRSPGAAEFPAPPRDRGECRASQARDAPGPRTSR